MRRLTLCALSAVFTLTAFAQNKTEEKALSSFTDIVVSDQFNITLKEGLSYKVETDIDERVADYCEFVVKGGILYIQLNEREIPKELKSLLHKKPLDGGSLKAVITVPLTASINKVTANEESVVSTDGKFGASAAFSFELSDKAKVSSFELKASSVEVITHNTASFNAKIEADNLNVTSLENSVAAIEADATNCKIKTDNSASVTVSGEFTNLNLETPSGLNWPKINVSGTAESVAVSGKGYADINLGELEAKSLDATLTLCTCKAKVTDSMKIELAQGAKFYYEGTPDIEIVKVQASTIGHFSDMK